jgi:hypothetical protein
MQTPAFVFLSHQVGSGVRRDDHQLCHPGLKTLEVYRPSDTDQMPGRCPPFQGSSNLAVGEVYSYLPQTNSCLHCGQFFIQ